MTDPVFDSLLSERGVQRGPLPKFTDPNNAKRFIHAVELGMAPKSACRVLGSSPELWKTWVHKAEMGDPLYEEFVGRVYEAEAACMAERMGDIEVAIHVARAQGDIRGIMEYMGRRWPDEWGVAARVDAAITIADATDTDDILRKLIPELTAAGAASDMEPVESGGEGSPEVHMEVLGETEPASTDGGLGHMAHPERPRVWQDEERRGVGPGTSRLPDVWTDNTGS